LLAAQIGEARGAYTDETSRLCDRQVVDLEKNILLEKVDGGQIRSDG